MPCLSPRWLLSAAPFLVLLACGPLQPPALDPGRPSDAGAPAKPVAKAMQARGAPLPDKQPSPPEPVVARTPLPVTDCTFRWQPKPLRASVLVIPEDYTSRFMVPLFDAVCACSRPGDQLAVTARILTAEGSVTAVTGRREDPEIAANPSVDACLAALLKAAPFEPFDVPSDVVCDDGPSTAAAPSVSDATEEAAAAGRRSSFRAPRRVGCSDHGGATIVYPILVDRRNE